MSSDSSDSKVIDADKVAGIYYTILLLFLYVLMLPITNMLDQQAQRKYIDEKAEERKNHPPRKRIKRISARQLCSRERNKIAKPTGFMGLFDRILKAHPWLAPCTGGPKSNTTIPQRFTVLFVAVFMALLLNAAFFWMSKRSSGQIFVQIFLAILFTIPCTILATELVMFFFVYSPRGPNDASRTHRSRSSEPISEHLPQPSQSQRREGSSSSEPHSDGSPKESESDSDQEEEGATEMGINPMKFSGDLAVHLVPSDWADVEASEELQANTLPSVSITGDVLLEVAASMELRGRHLQAVSVRALCLGRNLLSVVTDRTSHRELIAELSMRHGMQIRAAGSAEAMERPGGGKGVPPKAAVLLSTVLQSYMNLPAIVDEINLFTCPTKASRSNELYGVEMHSVIWRMALECVKAREFVLAEALFTMHLLVENPDLYFVFFDAPPPRSLNEIFARVLALTATPVSATTDLVNIGRLWGSLLACYHHKLDEESYAAAHWTSDRPSMQTLSALLGVDDIFDSSPVVEYGCVPYSIGLEHAQRIPLEVACAHCKNAESGSLVQAAHAFRLAEKPHLLQKWNSSEHWRVEQTTRRLTDAMTNDKDLWLVRTMSGRLFRRAVASTSAPTIRDVAMGCMDEAVGKQICRRGDAGDIRYCPKGGVASDALGFSSVPFAQRNALRLALDAHQNFYATIEYGRLLALFVCLETGSSTMERFGARYIEELNALAMRPEDRWLSSSANALWGDDSVPQGTRDFKCEIHGSNFSLGEYDGGDPVLISALNKDPSTRCVEQRYAAATVHHNWPLTFLTRLHPPNAMGTGSRFTPHIGIASAVNASYAGDSIVLFRGWYGPVILENCHGPPGRELLIAPLNYRPELFNPNQKLSSEEWGFIEQVTVGRDEDQLALLTLRNCHNIRICGLVFTEAPLCVHYEDSEDCRLQHCRLACQVACRCPTDDIVSPDSNDIFCVGESSYWAARRFPWWFVAIGHATAAFLIALAAILIILTVRDFKNSYGHEWIARSCATMLFIAVFIHPAYIAARRIFDRAAAASDFVKKYFF